MGWQEEQLSTAVAAAHEHGERGACAWYLMCSVLCCFLAPLG